MSGNSFGKKFRIMTWGESRGKAVGVVIDGCPSGLELTEKDIQKELDRRKPGQSDVTTQRKETDKVEILSGVFEGKTLGTPIALMVKNETTDTKGYENLKNVFRPGHADYTYYKKYGIYDYRGGGRASARETLGRVAAGGIAKKILNKKGIKIIAYTKQIGNIKAKQIDFDEIEKNHIRCPDKEAAKRMEEKILEIKGLQDSVGGIVEVIVKNVPPGLGNPVFDKLDADLAKALMSIGGVKGVEIGAGFKVAEMLGSENNDQITKKGFRTNNAGGILGGISTGQDIVIRIAVKPTPSIGKEQKTINFEGDNRKIKIKGDHDPCICPRIVPVAEAMISLVIADYI
jgi:chorismate synthase